MIILLKAVNESDFSVNKKLCFKVIKVKTSLLISFVMFFNLLKLFIVIIFSFDFLFVFSEKQNLVEEEKKRISERELKLMMEKANEERKEMNRQIVLRLIVS